MNHLLVDAGNTFCKIALYDDRHNKLILEEKFPYKNIDTFFKNTFKDLAISSLMISNVNNQEFDNYIDSIARKYWNISPKFFKSYNCRGKLKSQYDDINALGCDRWAAMVAILYKKNIQNFCVIDCGTAITIDLVIDSCHIGGLIAPGIYTSFKSLNQNTANLPILSNVEQIDHIGFIGKNTQDCIRTGVIKQTLALIEYTVLGYKKLYNTKIAVYITGGDSKLIYKLTKIDMFVKENLVIDGLQMAIKHELVV